MTILAISTYEVIEEAQILLSSSFNNVADDHKYSGVLLCNFNMKWRTLQYLVPMIIGTVLDLLRNNIRGTYGGHDMLSKRYHVEHPSKRFKMWSRDVLGCLDSTAM